mmetsp:Transcript_9271/g.22794  ORF Transcript_9271/g.22794 Transcript_9271/m.22794 type:complete len:741 (+) Transcript_9271:160-2382(+)
MEDLDEEVDNFSLDDGELVDELLEAPLDEYSADEVVSFLGSKTVEHVEQLLYKSCAGASPVAPLPVRDLDKTSSRSPLASPDKDKHSSSSRRPSAGDAAGGAEPQPELEKDAESSEVRPVSPASSSSGRTLDKNDGRGPPAHTKTSTAGYHFEPELRAEHLDQNKESMGAAGVSAAADELHKDASGLRARRGPDRAQAAARRPSGTVELAAPDPPSSSGKLPDYDDEVEDGIDSEKLSELLTQMFLRIPLDELERFRDRWMKPGKSRKERVSELKAFFTKRFGFGPLRLRAAAGQKTSVIHRLVSKYLPAWMLSSCQKRRSSKTSTAGAGDDQGEHIIREDSSYEYLLGSRAGGNNSEAFSTDTPSSGSASFPSEDSSGSSSSFARADQKKRRRKRDMVRKLLVKYSGDVELVKQLIEKRAGDTSFIKWFDKMSFTGGILNVILMCYLIFGPHKFLLTPYIYTAQFCVLIPWRFWKYKGLKWEYFLLDFCYSGNLLLLYYLWARPESEQLFCTVFGACCGPMLLASTLFRNSLVFHSWEHCTSVFIHVVPFLCCYVIRHESEEISGVSLFRKRPLRFAFTPPEDVTLYETFCLPLFFYFVQQCFVYVFSNFICPIPDDPEYLNLYRYVVGTNMGKQILNKCPGDESLHEAWYFFLNFCVAAVSMLPCILWYQSQAGMVVLGVVCITVNIWNGASFYVEVFSRKYQQYLKSQDELKALREEAKTRRGAAGRQLVPAGAEQQ